MNQLNQATVKITRQNKLNVDSTRGVYLLPSANRPARLESQINTLRMMSRGITPERLSFIRIHDIQPVNQ